MGKGVIGGQIIGYNSRSVPTPPPILDYRTPPRQYENPAADPVRKAMIDALDRRGRGPSSRMILIMLAFIAALSRILMSVFD